MRRLLPLLVLAACSEYDVQRDPVDPDPPIDTDVEPAGPQPDIEVLPGALDFGWWPEDCPTAPQTVTIGNVGDADLVVSGVTIGSTAFELSGNLTPTIAPGTSAQFSAVFEPGDIVEYTTAIEISSNDPDEPVASVDVIGRGSEDAMLEEVFRQPAPAAVDVLWIVDNSGSMSEETARLQDSFNVFIQSFVNLGLDYHIAVTTTDMDGTYAGAQGTLTAPVITSAGGAATAISAFLAATDLGSGGSGDEKGLDAGQAALSGAADPSFLRDEANLSVIVLSDENDYSGVGSFAFASWLDTVKDDPEQSSFSAIVGAAGTGIFDPGGCFDISNGTSAEGGTKYIEAVNATGGMWGNICDLDFDLVIQYLSYSAAGLHREFELGDTPANIGGIVVTVNGVEVPYNGVNGWTWDSTTNSVKFNGSSIPGPEAVIVVTYPVSAPCGN